MLREGYRMPRPANCSDILHETMLKCWDYDPAQRPTFEDIVKHLDSTITIQSKSAESPPVQSFHNSTYLVPTLSYGTNKQVSNDSESNGSLKRQSKLKAETWRTKPQHLFVWIISRTIIVPNSIQKRNILFHIILVNKVLHRFSIQIGRRKKTVLNREGFC